MHPAVRNLVKDVLQHVVLRGRFQWRIAAASRAVALTFDDGPHPEYTPAVLDVLARAGVRATFFLVGDAVLEYPVLARRIVEEGHAVAGHSQSHRVITSLSEAELLADLARCRAVIAEATGVDTPLFRPPKGELDVRSLLRVCAQGYRVVHWSKTFGDYRKDGTLALLDRMARAEVRAGDILLMHDNNAYTAEALVMALADWRRAGLDLVTL